MDEIDKKCFKCEIEKLIEEFCFRNIEMSVYNEEKSNKKNIN